MKQLILTSRFKRSLKKFMQRNPVLQKQVEKNWAQAQTNLNKKLGGPKQSKS